MTAPVRSIQITHWYAAGWRATERERALGATSRALWRIVIARLPLGASYERELFGESVVVAEDPAVVRDTLLCARRETKCNIDDGALPRAWQNLEQGRPLQGFPGVERDGAARQIVGHIRTGSGAGDLLVGRSVVAIIQIELMNPPLLGLAY